MVMIGADVRKIRERLGLTQEQLAARVGVHKNTVARWERDELSVRETTARLLQFLVREHGHATR
jgi:putative transcriptional regulator